MASTPSQSPAQEFHEEDENDEDDSDEDYDPAADATDGVAVAAAGDSIEVEILEVPPNQEDRDQEDAEEEEEEEEKGKGEDDKGSCGSQTDRAGTPNCPICLEPWTPEGSHRVCCIPCGHVYGKSCLERWLKRYQKSSGKCPQCNRKFKHKEIINLYAPVLVVPNDDLEKEVRSLRESNDFLKLENSWLQEEIKKQKKHLMDSQSSGRQKILCLERTSSSGSQRKLCAYPEERFSPPQTSFENKFISQRFCQEEARPCNLILQKDLRIDGARVMGIDASSQILIISGKAPGVSGEHVLNKISLLGPNEVDRIDLPSNTGVIRDMCILPNGLAVLASLGKRLSLFSISSNNCVLKHDLPAPAWSCSGDLHNPYHIYAGLQNGMLMVFDLRQTSRHVYSFDGLSRHPIHTIHSTLHFENTRRVLTASSAGPCVWVIGGAEDRPSLIPEMDSFGICISLAHNSSTGDLVASFRPKVELSNDIMPSQTSVSPSSSLSGTGRLGSHVLIKRNGASYEKNSVGCGNVSEVRMSKSAVISTEGNTQLFACGDELSRRVCLWNLPLFQVRNYLRPHTRPILDLKYARSTGPGFLGCISEETCQVYTCF